MYLYLFQIKILNVKTTLDSIKIDVYNIIIFFINLSFHKKETDVSIM